MLEIFLPESDTQIAEFIQLEHSLVSLSKWESKYEKPFFVTEAKTEEETIDYLTMMTLSEDFDPDWPKRLTKEQHQEVADYISSKQTATWFTEYEKERPSRETITSELIYYWMIAFQIPFDPCETWHLNRLLTLVKICGIKQTKPKKMSRAAQAEEYQRLNEERRKRFESQG